MAFLGAIFVFFISIGIWTEIEETNYKKSYRSYQQTLIELTKEVENNCSDDYVKSRGNDDCFSSKEELEAHKKLISENKGNIQTLYNQEIAELDQKIKETCETEKDKCASAAIAKENELKEMQPISMAQFYIDKYCYFAPSCKKSKDIVFFNNVGYGGDLCTALKCKYKRKCPSEESCGYFKDASKYLKTWNSLMK
jgi:hypothetical protein